MENLEKEIINRLNTFLSKYHLVITTVDAHNSIYGINYYLDDKIFVSCMYGWGSIDEMLFDSSFSIFHKLNNYNKHVSYYSNMQPYENIELHRYKRYVTAYNNIKYLENSSCLEELTIKMDLMGI